MEKIGNHFSADKHWPKSLKKSWPTDTLFNDSFMYSQEGYENQPIND